MKITRVFPRSLVAAALAAALLTASCSGQTASSTTFSPAASDSPVAPSEPAPASSIEDFPSAPTDPMKKWCQDYADITSIMAAAGTDQKSANTALSVMPQFTQLWSTAETGEIITPQEAAANKRAVEGYQAVVSLMALGADPKGPEVTAATNNLTATTEKDHALLQSSAGKVLGLCGAPSPVASPAATAS